MAFFTKYDLIDIGNFIIIKRLQVLFLFGYDFTPVWGATVHDRGFVQT
jgi:hypothetical protein